MTGDKFGIPMSKIAKGTKFLLMEKGKDGYCKRLIELKFKGIDVQTDNIEFEKAGKWMTIAEYYKKTGQTDRISFTVCAETWE